MVVTQDRVFSLFASVELMFPWLSQQENQIHLSKKKKVYVKQEGKETQLQIYT